MSKVEKIKIVPGEGYTIKMPDGSFLKAEGAEVVKSNYWLRRLKFGEVVLAGGAKKEDAPKKVEAKAEAKPEVKKEEKKEIKKEAKKK